METFTKTKSFVTDNQYVHTRQETLSVLDLESVDKPIVDIVAGFAKLPHCFTLQCCYGHFITSPEQDDHSLAPIPRRHRGPVRYRLAYIAFCIENSRRGRALRDSLSRIVSISPDYIQFGSPDWFWDQWINSYALQVEPAAHQYKDEAILETAEALETQKVRHQFFKELRAVLNSQLSE